MTRKSSGIVDGTIRCRCDLFISYSGPEVALSSLRRSISTSAEALSRIDFVAGWSASVSGHWFRAHARYETRARTNTPAITPAEVCSYSTPESREFPKIIYILEANVRQ